MAGAVVSAEYRYRVVRAAMVTPVIRELWLAPVATALLHQAGQYVLLSDVAHRYPQRSYSVANAPRADGEVSLLVTRYPGGLTSGWVHSALKPDDGVAIAGPYGTFVLDPGNTDPILLLAAGSGLAPNRALAEVLLADNPARRVILFFSARTSADAVDAQRFEGWERVHPNFRFSLTLTRDPGAPRHGHVPDLLPAVAGCLNGWEVFISGPTGFVTSCAAAAVRCGASATAVHTEEFFADPEPWVGAPPVQPASVRP